MPRFLFPQGRPGLAPGGLLRGLGERRMEPAVTPLPEEEPGAALRERVEEPLEKELPPGVEQTYLETPIEPFLAQLESYLGEQEFSPEAAASLINAIITAPAGRSLARARKAGRAGGTVGRAVAGAVGRATAGGGSWARRQAQARAARAASKSGPVKFSPTTSRVGRWSVGGGLPTWARGLKALGRVGSAAAKKFGPMIPLYLPPWVTGKSFRGRGRT
jgi:hypothetical protein